MREERPGHIPAAWTRGLPVPRIPSAPGEPSLAAAQSVDGARDEEPEAEQAEPLGEEIEVRSRPEPAGEEIPDGDASALDDLALEQIAEAVLVDGIGAASKLAMAAEVASDTRPGPREDVIVRAKLRRDGQ